MWNDFVLIVDGISDEFIGYVQCEKCGSVYKHKLGGATSNMIRHKCHNTVKFAISSSPLERQKIVQAAVQMCGVDLLPF